MAQGNLGNDKPKAYLPLGHIDAIENKEREEGEPVRWARVRLRGVKEWNDPRGAQQGGLAAEGVLAAIAGPD